MNITSHLANKDRERIRGYQDLLEFYQGKQWPGREKYGEKRLTFNYARVFIDKLTSYLMSGIGFAVEAVEDTPAARAGASEAEKALARVYEDNNLEQLDFETETDCAILGDGCYKVVWEEGEGQRVKGEGVLYPGRVRVTAPDVQGIYARWTGDDMSRVWKVASRYTLSAEEAEYLYGNSKHEIINPKQIPNSNIQVPNPPYPAAKLQGPGSQLPTPDSQLQTVVEVWTDETFELYLDDILIESRANPYGFIPFIIFPNLREPKKFWGTSDLVPIMEPQRELNRAFSQISHILELSGNPIAVLENVESSSDIAVRPGAVWNLPEDAKAYLLDLLQGGGLKLHIDYIDLLFRTLHDISEAPRAAFGGMDRDLSGVAMQIELYPLLQKVLRKRMIRSTVYNKRNRMILKLLQRFGARSREPGRNNRENPPRSPFSQGKGSDSHLLTPGSVYDPDRYHLKTAWGPVLPQDRARLIENEKTLVNTGIHSRRRAMDEVGVKDAETEFRRWLEEQKEIIGINRRKGADYSDKSL